MNSAKESSLEWTFAGFRRTQDKKARSCHETVSSSQSHVTLCAEQDVLTLEKLLEAWSCSSRPRRSIIHEAHHINALRKFRPVVAKGPGNLTTWFRANV